MYEYYLGNWIWYIEERESGIDGYANIITNGIPNIDTYGNLTPTNKWYTSNSSFYVNTSSSVSFENPCNVVYNNLIITSISGTRSSVYYLGLGESYASHELYYQVITATSSNPMVISLKNIKIPFYITFYNNSSGTTYPIMSNMYLTDDSE